jgi:nitronate monooxygenase
MNQVVDETGKAPIIAALDELLEAERAGARVALASAKGLPADGTLGTLIHAIHHDESHWCAMLSGEIERLGGAPSPRCGAFFGKAMAIEDLGERMTFLNRGQNWVVRKLDALLLLVTDETLRTRLADMRRGHVDNIERTTRTLAAQASE